MVPNAWFTSVNLPPPLLSNQTCRTARYLPHRAVLECKLQLKSTIGCFSCYFFQITSSKRFTTAVLAEF